MSEAKHTPGPWVVRQFPTGAGAAPRAYVMDAIPDREGKVVANVIAFPTTNPDHEANARLIAAAPDLLAACKELLEAEACAAALDPESCVRLYEAWRQVREAVSKATGT